MTIRVSDRELGLILGGGVHLDGMNYVDGFLCNDSVEDDIITEPWDVRLILRLSPERDTDIV